MHTPYTSVVPAELQDLRPSPSFTKSSIAACNRSFRSFESLYLSVQRDSGLTTYGESVIGSTRGRDNVVRTEHKNFMDVFHRDGDIQKFVARGDD